MNNELLSSRELVLLIPAPSGYQGTKKGLLYRQVGTQTGKEA